MKQANCSSKKCYVFVRTSIMQPKPMCNKCQNLFYTCLLGFSIVECKIKDSTKVVKYFCINCNDLNE